MEHTPFALGAEDVLRARLFGAFDVSYNDEPCLLGPSGPALQLLGYLLVYPQRRHLRADLVSRLLSRHSESVGRRVLTRALWQLRKRFSVDLFVTEGEYIWLSSTVQVETDLHTFQTLVQQHSAEKHSAASLRRIIGLYHGDLLPSLDGEWLDSLRWQLRYDYSSSVNSLIAIEKRLGNFDSALSLAKRSLSADLDNQELVREVMRLHAAVGQSKEALNVYDAVKQRIANDADFVLEAETHQLAEEIVERLSVVPNSYVPAQVKLPAQRTDSAEIHKMGELIGRQAELAELTAHCDAVLHRFESFLQTPEVEPAQDSSRFQGPIFVEGETGIGKSHLMRQVANGFEWRGGTTLWAHCAGGNQQPFQPLITAFADRLTPLQLSELEMLVDRQWLDVLVQLLPSLQSSDLGWQPPLALEPGATYERLLEALYQVLRGWSRFVPLMLIIEDMHEADADTLTAIGSLSERLARLNVLIVCVYRSSEARSKPRVWDWLVDQSKRQVRAKLSLGLLTKRELGQLVRKSVGSFTVSPKLEGYLYKETAGNPLFALETLRALREQALLPTDDDGEWTPPETLTFSQNIQSAIAKRFDNLTHDELTLLRTAAVLGEQFSVRMLDEACELSSVRIVITVQRLCQLDILRRQSEHYRFAHQQLHAVAYKMLSREQAQQLHLRAGLRMEQVQPHAAAQLAYHFERAEQWGKAVEYGILSAENAATLFAYHTAQSAFKTALLLLRTYRPFSREQQLRNEFAILNALQQFNGLSGGDRHAEESLQQLVALANQLEDPTYKVAATIRRAAYQLMRLEFEMAVETGLRGERLARQQSDEVMQASALEIVGNAMLRLGQLVSAENTFLRALSLVTNRPNQTLLIVRLVDRYLTVAKRQARFHNLPEVVRCLDAQYSANSHLTAVNMRVAAFTAYAAGDYDTAQHNLYDAPAEFHRVGDLRAMARAVQESAELSIELSEFGTAHELLVRAEQLVSHLADAELRDDITLSRARLLAEIGQHDDAESLLVMFETRDQPIARPLLHAHLSARIAYERREPANLRRILNEMWRLRQAQPTPVTLYHVHLDFGRYYMLLEDAERAITHYRQAFAAADKTNCRWWQALAHSYHAVALCSGGQMEEAAQQLDVLPAKHPHFERHPWLLQHRWLLQQALERHTIALQVLQDAYQAIELQRDQLETTAWQRDFYTTGYRQGVVKAVAQRRALQRHGQKRVKLAAVDAPASGRALTEQELIEVVWTIDSPDDDHVKNKRARRQQKILRLLQEAAAQRAIPTVDDLADVLVISKRTLLYDLKTLREQGHAIVTRGTKAG